MSTWPAREELFISERFAWVDAESVSDYCKLRVPDETPASEQKV